MIDRLLIAAFGLASVYLVGSELGPKASDTLNAVRFELAEVNNSIKE